MATHISIDDAQAWIEPTKLTLSTLDTNLEAQVSALVLSRLLGTFDTASWVNDSTTPGIVRTIIAMHYVAWLYDKYYSDDAEDNAYAALLRRYADANIAGLVAGNIELIELPDANEGVSSPVFFPNDLSSAQEPTDTNPSDGGPAFTMGRVF